MVETPAITAQSLPEAEGTDKVITLDELKQILAPSKDPADTTETLSTTKPTTYTLYTQTVKDAENNDVIQYNKRTYRMIFWIHEAAGENVTSDVGKNFKATLYITTGDGTTGVTGQIATAVQSQQN